MRQASRGEVWLVDLGLAAKVRPALVISVPYQDPERSLVTLVPHTTAVRQSRFEAAEQLSRQFVLFAPSAFCQAPLWPLWNTWFSCGWG